MSQVQEMTEKQLFQVTPTGTIAAVSPAAKKTIILKHMIFCNTTTGTVQFTVYNDDDGTTRNAATALLIDQELTSKQSFQWDGYVVLNNSSGEVAVKTDTSQAITFTGWGAELQHV